MKYNNSQNLSTQVFATIIAALLLLLMASTIGIAIRLLWNYVAPGLGIPTISNLQALAMFLLYRLFNISHAPKQRLILNLPKSEEHNQHVRSRDN